MRKPLYQFLAGLFLVAAIAVSCNSKKDKKEEPVKTDTTVVEPAPAPPVTDTTKKTGDTLDTRPVKPGE